MYIDNLGRSTCPRAAHDDTSFTQRCRPHQQETLFAFLDSDKCSARHRDAVVVLLETGLRISEFCGLTVDNIDFSTNTLQVKRQMIYRKIGGVYRSYIQTPKTIAGYQSIPLNPLAVQSLHSLIARADLSVRGDSVTGFIMARNSSACTANSVERWIQTAIRRIRKKEPSFSNVTPHILRHTFCTNLFRLGVNPKAIQKIMGHAKISTTLDVYTHMEDEVLRKQIGELGNSISFIGTRRKTAEALPDSKEVDDLKFTPFCTLFERKDINRIGGIRL